MSALPGGVGRRTLGPSANVCQRFRPRGEARTGPRPELGQRIQRKLTQDGLASRCQFDDDPAPIRLGAPAMHHAALL
jgi:hypothetical protein